MLYSDGLVERRNQSITEGLARLEAVCGPHTDPNTLLDQIVQALLGDESQPDDDVTLLALHAAPSGQ
jgi:serine phosphatase RsbU (regulator of sigma subunit)